MGYILVIEDDESLSKMLRDVMQKAGHEVLLAPDGVVGLEMFKQRSADLIIVDIVMPKKDGIEVILELRTEYPDIKILAISGGGKFGTFNYLEHAKLFGAHRTLSKPFDTNELLETVQELLLEKN